MYTKRKPKLYLFLSLFYQKYSSYGSYSEEPECCDLRTYEPIPAYDVLDNFIKFRSLRSKLSRTLKRMFSTLQDDTEFDEFKTKYKRIFHLDINTLKKLRLYKKNLEYYQRLTLIENIEFVCPESSYKSVVYDLYRHKPMVLTDEMQKIIEKIKEDMEDHFVFIIGFCYGGAGANRIALELDKLSSGPNPIATNYSVIACNSIYVATRYNNSVIPRLINYMYINDLAIKFNNINNPSASKLNYYIKVLNHNAEGNDPKYVSIARLYVDPDDSQIIWYCRPHKYIDRDTNCKTTLTKPSWRTYFMSNNSHADYTFIFRVIFYMIFNSDEQDKLQGNEEPLTSMIELTNKYKNLYYTLTSNNKTGGTIRRRNSIKKTKKNKKHRFIRNINK